MDNQFKHLNGTALAYIGDAVYEVYVRDYLLHKGLTKVNALHKEAKQYVSAKAQSSIMARLIESELLTTEELMVFKRGRNAKSHTSAKNTDVLTYKVSTGFEALLGYLYMSKQSDRLNELMALCVNYVGENHETKI